MRVCSMPATSKNATHTHPPPPPGLQVFLVLSAPLFVSHVRIRRILIKTLDDTRYTPSDYRNLLYNFNNANIGAKWTHTYHGACGGGNRSKQGNRL